MARKHSTQEIDPKFAQSCQLCGATFQFGNHIYDGKKIPQYDLLVCRSCYDGNWDGWGPVAEPNFVRHMKEKGIPLPERNEEGWYPRGN